jgi:hypothetical protein
MKSLDFGRYALSVGAAAAWLAGCGGSQPPIAAPGAMPQRRNIATHAERDGSWMLPEAKGRNLLYAASPSNDIVDVYAYPGGKLVGSLGTFDGVGGLCVNKEGDVFITVFNDHAVYEFAHGGTKQIATLRSPYSVNACSVDPKTENVAVASYYGAIIFRYSPKRGYRFAKYYADSAVYYGAYCTYDAKGDLFMDGTAYQGTGFALSELQSGSNTFGSITLDQSINGPGAMQWRGNILTVADRGNGSVQAAVIYRFTIDGDTGTQVGDTTLTDSDADAQFWIQGSRVIGPEAGSAAGIGVWDYPGGGAPIKSIVGFPPYGVVVSLK